MTSSHTETNQDVPPTIDMVEWKVNDTTKITNTVAYVALDQLMKLLRVRREAVEPEWLANLVGELLSREYLRVRKAVAEVNSLIASHNRYVTSQRLIKQLREQVVKTNTNRERTGALLLGDPRRPAWMNDK